MQAGCHRFESVRLHHPSWATAAQRLLEPEQRQVLSRSDKFASRRKAGCIDIVKEGFDRPVHGFEVRFEKTSSGKVKSGVTPVPTSFQGPDPVMHEFC